jgi:Tfp pilus assembly protein PilV
MKLTRQGALTHQATVSGLTLVEVLISLMIITLVFAGVGSMYVQTTYRAQWSGYSLAAQALAIQQLEQAKSAVWDTRSVPIKNELTNIATVTAGTLDLPVAGTNIVWATNYATIRPITIWNNPPVTTYLVKVDTVWPFHWSGVVSYYTNTIADCLAPD